MVHVMYHTIYSYHKLMYMRYIKTNKVHVMTIMYLKYDKIQFISIMY